jgi:hypothetical protein
MVKFVFDTLEFSIPFVNTFTRPDSGGNINVNVEEEEQCCVVDCIAFRRRSQ